MTIRAAALIASLALAACGGSSLKAYPEEPLPQTPEGTLAALDQAEGQLRLALGEPPSSSMGAPTQPSATSPGASASPSPPPPPPASPPPVDAQSRAPSQIEADAPAPTKSGGSADEPAGDPCASVCRALASMMRATEHLCALAGAADARCEGARSRVQSAGERVQAHCPRCAGS